MSKAESAPRTRVSSEQERQFFLEDVAAHSADHQNARAHKDFQAAMCEKYPQENFMLLLDGTPGPTFPSWAGGQVPSELKGSFGIPLFWEVGKSYSTGQVYFAMSLKWWAKGANFMLELKYHLLRAALSSPDSADVRNFFDWWDGGSENRNFPNFAFLAELAHVSGLAVECARLWVGHTHNDGDALIKAPRGAFQASACKNIGDIIQAMSKPFKQSRMKPIFVFVHQIHDWTKRATAIRNKRIKYLNEPHCWKVATCQDGLTPGLVYKDRHNSEQWRGAWCAEWPPC
jgi:hypothetical protein